MKNNQLSIGIIGLGSFGMFIGEQLLPHASVVGFDRNRHDDGPIEQVAFEQLFACNVIVLAVPLSSLRTTLEHLAASIQPGTLVVDVCSVKSTPGALIDEILPVHPNILLTHPLFGPQSAASSTRGHKLIITRETGQQARRFVQLLDDKLGLDITHMSAERHDRSMAQVHALTFFVARGLKNMQLETPDLVTPSYNALLNLVDLDQHHSEELFQTVENGNPYAKETREQFLATLEELHEAIQNDAS